MQIGIFNTTQTLLQGTDGEVKRLSIVQKSIQFNSIMVIYAIGHS